MKDNRYKYETIKELAARDAESRILGHNPDAHLAAFLDAIAEPRTTFEESLTALAKRVRRRIETWDVRYCGKLREIFPAAFPVDVRRGAIAADYDDEGDWTIYPA